jgi:signal transduction histidine kinase
VEERTKELRLAYDRLQELGRVKGNVLGIVSHELRTPLNQAKMALELVLQTDIPADKQQELLHQALNSFGLLEYRVGDIEAFTDPTELRLSPMSLPDLVNASVEQVRNLRRGKHDTIELDLSTAIPPVMVSPIAVTRALAHLIQNAVKFGEGKPVHVAASTDETHVHVRILDQGPGIKSEILPTLFEPLEQGDASSTRHHGGLGIGLSLAKMIFDAHQIKLALTSNPGKGTEVTISIPLATI